MCFPVGSRRLPLMCCPVGMQAAAITVLPYGDAVLLGNYYQPITLTAATQPGCGASGTLTANLNPGVFANLNPTELDVDVGQPFGAQLQAQPANSPTVTYLSVGSSFSMDVRVNSASSPLIAFQVRACWMQAGTASTAGRRVEDCTRHVMPAECTADLR